MDDSEAPFLYLSFCVSLMHDAAQSQIRVKESSFKILPILAQEKPSRGEEVRGERSSPKKEDKLFADEL